MTAAAPLSESEVARDIPRFPETRIGLSASSATTRTEPLHSVSLASHRAYASRWPKPAAGSSSPSIDEPLALYAAGAVSYLNADGLGSVTATNGAAGTVSHNSVFDAWGVAKSETGMRVHSFTYTGREVGEAGLHFYRARSHQAATGRFTQEDPIGPSLPLSYTYVTNRPVRLLDPSGLTPVESDDEPEITGRSKLRDGGRLTPGDWWIKEPNARVPNTYGAATTMCDGGGMPVPFYPAGAHSPEQLACYGDCLFLHEATHVADILASSPTVCWGMPRGTVVHPKTDLATPRSEIHAYSQSIPCMQGKLRADPGNKRCCNTLIRKQLKQDEQYLSGFEWYLATHGGK